MIWELSVVWILHWSDCIGDKSCKNRRKSPRCIVIASVINMLKKHGTIVYGALTYV